ncbi:sulfotransferase 1C4-like [Uloborus diversus]|uniref:sulfotransferase 1C4-like n=1 Tax=Uloborus diversus TaxID=327109 RepID=UPI002409BB23|nr:sulfotransferase 1C4-like [Uloborus diversus]
MPKDTSIVPYKIFRGFKIPKGGVEEYFEYAADYKPKPGDIFLVSYPKCGTTWVQQLLYLVHSKGIPAPGGWSEMVNKVPFLEQDGPNNLDGALAFKYHLPYHLMPMSSDAKYIYVARNPKDACVSYYHFLKGLPGYSIGEFNEFFEAFLTEQLPHGCIIDHVKDWYQHRNLPNILFLTYEELKINPRAEILKLADFLDISIDETALEGILKYSSFNFMHHLMEEGKDFVESYLRQTTRLNSNTNSMLPKMLRKGVVGDWKSHFSPEQSKRLNDKFLQKTKGTGMELLWTAHMGSL